MICRLFHDGVLGPWKFHCASWDVFEQRVLFMDQPVPLLGSEVLEGSQFLLLSRIPRAGISMRALTESYRIW